MFATRALLSHDTLTEPLPIGPGLSKGTLRDGEIVLR